MNHTIWENIIKNVIVIILLVPSYGMIQSSLASSPAAGDTSVLGSLLVAVGILSVTACFGNFAFTYEKVKHTNTQFRLIAHATTGLFMLLIGLSLEMTSVIVKLLVGPFLIFDLILLILYIASVLYDFWDLYSNLENIH